MTETLLEIDSFSIPSTTVQDTSRLSRIKKWLIGYTLLPDQQSASLNVTPYFMTLVTVIRFLFLIGVLITNVVYKRKRSLDFLLPYSFLVTSCIGSHIFIGIPLEIAHGTIRIAAFYAISIIYPHIVGEVILSKYDFLDMDPCALALIGLHLSNLIRNWFKFPRRILRLFVLLTFAFLLELYVIKENIPFGYWRVTLFRMTCGFAGFLYGFLTGYLWVYRNKEEDKPETTWKSYAIILTCLAVYLIAVEFSGLHITQNEFFKEKMGSLKAGNID